MDLDEYLNTQRVQKVAVAMEKKGPMTFRQFKEATGYWDTLASQVRDRMESWNLIRVSWKNKKTQLIELTIYGREYVAMVHEQARLVEKAIKAKSSEKPPP